MRYNILTRAFSSQYIVRLPHPHHEFYTKNTKKIHSFSFCMYDITPIYRLSSKNRKPYTPHLHGIFSNSYGIRFHNTFYWELQENWNGSIWRPYLVDQSSSISCIHLFSFCRYDSLELSPP